MQPVSVPIQRSSAITLAVNSKFTMKNENEEINAPINHKRKKQYSCSSAQKRRKFILEPGLKGFLCSCNFREKECVRESYNILNEYADILFGSERKNSECLVEEVDAKEDVDGLLKEIEQLKSENVPSQRRFQVVESGAKNFLFIRTSVDDPVRLAETIVNDISSKNKQKTRFLLRLIPIEATCKAYIDDIQRACEPLLEKYFKTAPKSFAIVFNHRNNNQISRDAVIKAVADMVTATRPDHTVNLTEADLSIVIEIIRNIALVGVIPNFNKFKKYNLQAICHSTEAAPKSDDDKTELSTEAEAKTPLKDSSSSEQT